MKYVGDAGAKPRKPSKADGWKQPELLPFGERQNRTVSPPADSMGELYRQSDMAQPKPYSRGVNIREQPKPGRDLSDLKITRTGRDSVTITKKED